MDSELDAFIQQNVTGIMGSRDNKDRSYDSFSNTNSSSHSSSGSTAATAATGRRDRSGYGRYGSSGSSGGGSGSGYGGRGFTEGHQQVTQQSQASPAWFEELRAADTTHQPTHAAYAVDRVDTRNTSITASAAPNLVAPSPREPQSQRQALRSQGPREQHGVKEKWKPPASHPESSLRTKPKLTATMPHFAASTQAAGQDGGNRRVIAVDPDIELANTSISCLQDEVRKMRQELTEVKVNVNQGLAEVTTGFSELKASVDAILCHLRLSQTSGVASEQQAHAPQAVPTTTTIDVQSVGTSQPQAAHDAPNTNHPNHPDASLSANTQPQTTRLTDVAGAPSGRPSEASSLVASKDGKAKLLAAESDTQVSTKHPQANKDDGMLSALWNKIKPTKNNSQPKHTEDAVAAADAAAAESDAEADVERRGQDKRQDEPENDTPHLQSVPRVAFILCGEDYDVKELEPLVGPLCAVLKEASPGVAVQQCEPDEADFCIVLAVNALRTEERLAQLQRRQELDVLPAGKPCGFVMARFSSPTVRGDKTALVWKETQAVAHLFDKFAFVVDMYVSLVTNDNASLYVCEKNTKAVNKMQQVLANEGEWQCVV